MKRVTLKDIANELNISVGTIDRAIHGRGRINEETRNVIMQKISEKGYKPNGIARVLGKNKITKLAFVTPAHNPFFAEIIKGAQVACDELADYGIQIDFYTQNSLFESLEQVRQMDEVISQTPSGIIIVPLQPFLLSAPINQAIENDIPVITVNLDSKDSKRFCYVGQDPFNTGTIVGTIFGKLMQGRGNIAVLNGNVEISTLQLRTKGFLDILETNYPKIKNLGFYEYVDQIEVAYEIAKKLITDFPGLKGLFANTTFGSIGIGRAIKDLNKIGMIAGVSYDDSEPEVIDLLDCNALFATVTQNPFSQGYYAVKLIFKLILEKNRPDKEYYYTNADIIINSAHRDLNATGLLHSNFNF